MLVKEWDHNRHYHPAILRRLPPRFARALDVGCGTGEFAAELARRADTVVALDADSRELQLPGVTFVAGDVMTSDVMTEEFSDGFDVVTALAVLHHLPLEEALVRFRALVRPGGTLVVLGLYRERTPVDVALSLAAVPANIVMGRLGRPAPPDVRTKPAETTLAEIRRAADRVLPGATIHRRLFWRYLLVWRA